MSNVQPETIGTGRQEQGRGRRARRYRTWMTVSLGLLALFCWRVVAELQHARLERPLMSAVSRSDTAEVGRLLFWGADPNSRSRPEENRRNFLVLLKNLLIHNRSTRDEFPTALAVALTARQRNFAIVKMLVEAGAELNKPVYVTSGYGATPNLPLNYVCYWGEPGVVRLLIAHGASVSAADWEGNTPLHCAAGSSAECIQILLAHGASVNARNRYGNGPINNVASAAPLEALVRAGADVNQRGNWAPPYAALQYGADLSVGSRFGKGWSALVTAAQARNLAVTALFVSHHADVNSQSESKQVALMFAAVKGLDAIARILIESGANVNARDKDGNTALADAARWGHVAIVRMLLAHGADIAQTTRIGWTPLMAAAYGGNADIVRLLLQHGANLHLATERGETALMAAADAGSLPCLKLLLDAGGDARMVDKQGNTLLMYAVGGVPEISSHSEDDRYAQCGRNPTNPRAVAYLLNRGVPINARNRKGETALFQSAEDDRSTYIVSLLLFHGASPNVPRTSDGSTPLMAAAPGYRMDTVRLLIAHGADPRIRDKRGQQALDRADAEEMQALLTTKL